VEQGHAPATTPYQGVTPEACGHTTPTAAPLSSALRSALPLTQEPAVPAEKVALLTVSHFIPFESYLCTCRLNLGFSTRYKQGQINPLKGKESNGEERDPLARS